MLDRRAMRIHKHELKRARRRKACRYAQLVKDHGALEDRMTPLGIRGGRRGPTHHCIIPPKQKARVTSVLENPAPPANRSGVGTLKAIKRFFTPKEAK